MDIMKIYFIVYKITNTINNESYIGCHKTKNLDDGYMGSGKRIKAAIKEFGRHNFDKQVLFMCTDSREMLKKEVELIAHFKPEYNIHKGGQGGWELVNKSGRNNHPWTAEARQKMREIRLGSKASPERLYKMRISQTGKRLTPETKKKMSEVRKGRKMSEEVRLKISTSMKKAYAENRR